MTPRPPTPGTLADIRVVDLTRAHTGEILREAGYDDEKVAVLRAAGVVR